MSKNKLFAAFLSLMLCSAWLSTALASGGGGGAQITAIQNTDTTITVSNNQGTVTISRPAISGDVSIPGASNVATLASVNSNVGTFGSASTVPQLIANAKGLITGVANVTITPSAIGAPTTTGTGASGTWGIAITGNATTATAFAASPSACPSNQFVIQISANGTPTCAAPTADGYVAGPGSSTVGFAPLWNNTGGTVLGVGLPVAQTGNSTIVETSSGGTISSSIVPTLNQNTTGSAGSATLVATTSSSTNSSYFFLGVASASNGNQAATLNSGITFNPFLASITATTFNGALNGNAATVTTNANTTGDVTSVGNVTTLATVNTGPGSFGSATSIPVLTINGKGLVTASTSAAITPIGIGAMPNSVSATCGTQAQANGNSLQIAGLNTPFNITQFGTYNFAPDDCGTTIAESLFGGNGLSLPNPGVFWNGWYVNVMNISSIQHTITVPSGVLLNGVSGGSIAIPPSGGSITVSTDGNNSYYATGFVSGVAATVTTASTTTSASYFPLFAAANSAGNQVPQTNASLTYNPGTATLSATTLAGALTGNASTATALQTARTIGGVSFNGTANITVASATGGFAISGGGLTLSAQNLVTDTTTGTDIGTSTTQKLGFFGVTPVVQQTGDALTALSTYGFGTLTIGISDLPVATSSAKGIVQGDGSTLTITSGTISCTTATSSQIGCAKPDGTILTISAGTETVAKATNAAFGVVEAGTNLSVTAGVLSVPNATGSSLGAAEGGSGITVSSGIFSVTNPAPSSSTTGDVATFTNTTGAWGDSGTALSSLATTASLTSIALGTSASATNPQRASEPGTGVFSGPDQTVSLSANSVEALRATTLSAGVDYVAVTPGKSAAAPIIADAGSTTNQSLELAFNGTGNVLVGYSAPPTNSPTNALQVNGPITVPNNKPYQSFNNAGILVNIFNLSNLNVTDFYDSGAGDCFLISSQANCQITIGHNNYTLTVGNTGTGTGILALANATASSGLTNITASTSTSTSWTMTLPTGAGAANAALSTDGTGITTWNPVVNATAGTPTCGTGCTSITAGSTNLRGSMVTSASITSAVLDWSATLGYTPVCTISDNSTATVSDISSISTTALTVGFASSLSSVTVYWICSR